MSLDFGTIAGTRYDNKGYPETQVNPIGDGSMVAAEDRHPYGFHGCPNDPDVDATSGKVTNGANVLYVYEGSTLHTVRLDDPRVTAKLPQLGKGGSVHYGAGPSGPSWAQHDGAGNYTVQVPTNANSVALTTADGSLLVKLAGGVVQVGDAQAAALATAVGLNGVIGVLSGLASALSALQPAVTPATYKDLNTLGGSLTAAIQALELLKLVTTKAMGT